MYTDGDTYSVRGGHGHTSARHTQSAGRTAQVDAQVAALSERIAQLEGTVRRLDTLIADLEGELREVRRQAGAQTVRSTPKAVEFETEPTSQTRWIPGAAPRSGTQLRASRSHAYAAYSDDAPNP